MPLGVVLVLIILKHIPATEHLPLARLAGIVSFGYAIFLSLRLIQGEEAVSVEGWSELRPSPVELFGAFGGAAFSGLLLMAVLTGNALQGATAIQMGAALGLSVALALTSGAIVFTSFLVKIRWNRSFVEKQDHRGRKVAIAWADVIKVQGRWRGITIYTADKQRLSFSPLHSGAAQLAKFAAERAKRNAAPAAQAFWG